MLLTEGTQYRLENVRTDEYNGNMSIQLNSSTEISFLEEEKDMSNSTEFEGALVALQSGSGLIKRCPEDDCNRPLGKNDRCPEHGEVEGVHDLRIKAVLDDGSQTQTVIINDNDLIEELTGLTLDDAKEMARDALDHAVVAKEMENTLLGKYYTASGPYINYFIAASEFAQSAEMTDVDSLLIEARSL
jgi:replication factor A1